MMTAPPAYLLDANIFIEAHKRYYAFDICPGYWTALLSHHNGAHLRSIDRVRDELISQADALSQWIQQQVPASFFAATGDRQVTEVFSNVVAWVQNKAQYLPAAKTAFAAGADGWLVAYARVHGLIVATDEVQNPGIRRRVPIPNVCDAFGVDCIDTFNMLRALGARFH
ncbi:DUF4411 family protein [Bradyrhizobium sp.]|uniref:DUF4411 family protein n=1 Tax=Bradyrhizobium sp. TaxID=376 RepID=UPI002D346F93|nr:DUF4411 family protein [Bradyrhizobium sp.]HZR77006.1 DUF4411 family protein [Bradyrhizobium sp.]